MTNKEPRKDDMRNITLMEYERKDKSGQTRGWWVRVKRGNQSFSHLFSYNKYGGKENALIEAKRFRDKLEEEYGRLKDIGYQVSPTRRNKSGMIGIHRVQKITRRRSGRIYVYDNWIASWIDPVTRKRVNKPFLVSRYGEEGARILAIKAREEAIAEISGGKQASTFSLEEIPLPQLVEIVETAQTAHEKGRALESLACRLFMTDSGLQILERDTLTETEEIDIFILNSSSDPRFVRESAYFLVECKNWSGKCGKDEFVLFKQKIENRKGRCNLGFLISWNGFTDTIPKEMLRGSREMPLIVLLDGKEIKQAVKNSDFIQVLIAAYDKAIKL
jgi:Holliday junction resolvase-like predicted endonuclease